MNRAWENGTRLDVEGGPCSTGARREPSEAVEDMFGPSTVGELVARGGWSRPETPSGDVPAVLRKSRMMNGSAGSGGKYTSADYPGGPSA